MPVRSFFPLRLLALCLCAGLLAACDTSSPEPPADGGAAADTTLRALARARGIEVGAAVATTTPNTDVLYQAVLAREFGMMTAENAMKFSALHPAQGTYTFTDADALVDFAERNDMRVRGHTLIWHNQLPGWVTGTNWTRDEMIAILEDHIDAVVGRYKGRIGAWDVVNEAVSDEGGMRNTVWLDRIGPEYLALAFRQAHAADPDAQLYYNDYSAEGLTNKADEVYELVRDLKNDGVPIHGVGLQMHLTLTGDPTPTAVAANIARLNALGLDVQITEMDVRMELPADESKLFQQATRYRNMLNVCLDADACSAFVLWGFTDRYSWIPSFFPGAGAALIFDAGYDPKPAYHALQDALLAE